MKKTFVTTTKEEAIEIFKKKVKGLQETAETMSGAISGARRKSRVEPFQEMVDEINVEIAMLEKKIEKMNGKSSEKFFRIEA